MVTALCCGVESSAKSVAVVHHRPRIGTLQGKAHDTVLNLVLIGIGLHGGIPMRRIEVVLNAQIELLGVFGFQVSVAHLSVV